MSEQITLLADDLPIKKIKSVADHVDNAYSKLQSVYATAILAYGFAGADGQVFAGSEDDCAAILSLLSQSSAEIEQLSTLLESGSAQIEEADNSFKGVLVETWWDKFKSNFRFSIGQTPIGKILGVAAPLVTLLAPATVPGSSGGGSRGENSEVDLIANDEEEERSKVKIKPGDEASDIGKSAQDAVVDNYRKEHGKEGKKEEYERYIYSSTDSGTVSILGTDFRYDKYTDYIGGSFEAVDGDSFYSVDTEFGKECQHIDFEATDGSGLSGDITMNGIKLYGDGEFDLAKGNAYMKAGADYTVASITVDAESDFGGFSLTGEVGAGAHLDAGIHDGKFTVDVGAALGVGAGVKFEINYEAIWEATCDAFGF